MRVVAAHRIPQMRRLKREAAEAQSRSYLFVPPRIPPCCPVRGLPLPSARVGSLTSEGID